MRRGLSRRKSRRRGIGERDSSAAAGSGPYTVTITTPGGSATAGRIRAGPAPLNLCLPDYEFLSPTKVKIG